ncbi:MAG: membrane dipeptidase, partial [Chitinophagaceae bacterium]
MRSTWLGLILLTAPFNLLMAQSPNAVHFSGILVDTHNDFPSASIQKQVSLDANLKGITHTDLARLFAGGVDVQVFSIFCDGKQVQPYNWARREIDSVEAWARRNPQQLTILH